MYFNIPGKDPYSSLAIYGILGLSLIGFLLLFFAACSGSGASYDPYDTGGVQETYTPPSGQ